MRGFAAVLLFPSIGQAAPCSPPEAAITKVRLTADAVEACYDATCWRLPFATRAWEPGPDFAAPDRDAPAAPQMEVEISPIVRVGDRDVHLPPDASIAQPGSVAASADRTRIAMIGPAVEGKRGVDTVIYLFDGHKLVTTIHGWKTGMGDPAFFRSVQFLEDTLFVAISSSPITSSGRLYDGKTGARLADVARGVDLDESLVVDLGDHHVAFAEFYGNGIAIHDLRTGRALPRIATAAPKTELGTTFSLFARTADGATLVAVRGDAKSGATLVNAKTYKAVRVGVPSCK